jgi:hypothetical protein
MRLSQRLIAAAVLVSLSAVLGGCSSSLGSWDPTDLLDFLDTKKKLPGDRKPVFPDGVPGLEQGVPKELYKGAQEQPDQQNANVVAAPPPPVEEPKSKRASRKKPKPPANAAADPNADPNAPAEDASAAGVAPDPKPKKIVRRRTTAPPPDAQTDGQQQSAAPFPAPMPSNTFQR